MVPISLLILQKYLPSHLYLDLNTSKLYHLEYESIGTGNNPYYLGFISIIRRLLSPAWLELNRRFESIDLIVFLENLGVDTTPLKEEVILLEGTNYWTFDR